jgi:hypothetical protein
MASPIVEAFSLSHVAILDGTTGLDALDGDVYGVNSASIELDADSFDNVGDDLIRSTWNWGNRGNLSVQAGYLSFNNLASIYGIPVISSGAGNAQTFSMLAWERKSMNPAPKPVLIRMPSRDKFGISRNLDIILFRVQFAPFTFDGPAYKDGLKINYTGQALFSDVDEKGVTVRDSAGNPTEAIGRIFSGPAT